ncbi:hypothetical protein FRB91_003668, partial [Serendipita sp. 411]
MAFLISRPLQILRITRNELSYRSVLYEQCSSFHASASTAKGGKRNPEHKMAARAKKQGLKRQRSASAGGSERRLAKPTLIAPDVNSKFKAIQKVQRIDVKLPRAAERQTGKPANNQSKGKKREQASTKRSEEPTPQTGEQSLSAEYS